MTQRNEDYPGQNYFHKHNVNIRRAEENFNYVPKLQYLDIYDCPSNYYLRTGCMLSMRQWVTKEELEQMLFGESNERNA
jgi:hypothetical protein